MSNVIGLFVKPVAVMQRMEAQRKRNAAFLKSLDAEDRPIGGIFQDILEYAFNHHKGQSWADNHSFSYQLRKAENGDSFVYLRAYSVLCRNLYADKTPPRIIFQVKFKPTDREQRFIPLSDGACVRLVDQWMESLALKQMGFTFIPGVVIGYLQTSQDKFQVVHAKVVGDNFEILMGADGIECQIRLYGLSLLAEHTTLQTYINENT